MRLKLSRVAEAAHKRAAAGCFSHSQPCNHGMLSCLFQFSILVLPLKIMPDFFYTATTLNSINKVMAFKPTN